jgi:hypothetical protein
MAEYSFTQCENYVKVKGVYLENLLRRFFKVETHYQRRIAALIVLHQTATSGARKKRLHILIVKNGISCKKKLDYLRVVQKVTSTLKADRILIEELEKGEE